MPFCTSCGHSNPEVSRFCGNCGNQLRAGGEVTSTVSLSGVDAGGVEAGGAGLGGPDGGALDGEPPEAALLSPADQAAVDVLPADAALLVVRRGPNSGSRFLLEGEVTTVGRHPQSDIFLDDVTVSRRHAEFLRSPGGFAVRDVGSLNGTYVNRVRIDSTALAGGDEVQVGKYRLAFYPSQARVPHGQAGQGSRS